MRTIWTSETPRGQMVHKTTLRRQSQLYFSIVVRVHLHSCQDRSQQTNLPHMVSTGHMDLPNTLQHPVRIIQITVHCNYWPRCTRNTKTAGRPSVRHRTESTCTLYASRHLCTDDTSADRPTKIKGTPCSCEVGDDVRVSCCSRLHPASFRSLRSDALLINTNDRKLFASSLHIGQPFWKASNIHTLSSSVLHSLYKYSSASKCYSSSFPSLTMWATSLTLAITHCSWMPVFTSIVHLRRQRLLHRVPVHNAAGTVNAQEASSFK